MEQSQNGGMHVSPMTAAIVGLGALALGRVIGAKALLGVAALGGAAYLLTRAGTKGQAISVERSITVMKPAQEVYAFWRKLENLPRFMSHLEEVREVDERRSVWVAKAPLGTKVEWEAEITADEPGKRIAWRSLEGSQIPNWGEVRFEDLGPERGTVIKVRLDYKPPAGAVGAAVAKLFGEEPHQQVSDDLRRLQQTLESGETATIAGQPVGSGQPHAKDGRKTTQGM